MQNTLRTLALLGASLGVSACGGGEAAKMAQQGAASQTFATKEYGSIGATFDLARTAVKYNGEIISQPTDTKIDSPSVFVHAHRRNASAQSSGSRLVNGEIQTIRSNSGKTYAFAFGNRATGVNFTKFGRSTETIAPVSGIADYEGNYMGMYKYGAGPNQGQTRDVLILGDTTLGVDFGANTVSGRITNRRLSETPSYKFDDVILNNGVMNGDGVFTGTAIGGRPSSSGNNRPGRIFEGVVGGDTGGEVAGYLRTDWTVGTGASAIEYSETGVFQGEKQ